MTHEFGDALGQGQDQRRELGRAVVARDLEARKMVGGPASMMVQNPLETAPEHAERRAGEALGPGDPAAGQWEVEGPPDPGNLEFFGDPTHRFEHWRQKMG